MTESKRTHHRSSPMGSDRTMSFKATQGIHTSLAGLADELGVSMSAVIRIAVEEYVDKKQQEGER